MSQDEQTCEIAQLFENLSHEDMVKRAKEEFWRRIQVCGNYYGYDSDDSNRSYGAPDTCCVKHNSLCQDALDKYDMTELLQTAETWYKELHSLGLNDETFVELFLQSLPEDVYVLLDDVNMGRYTYCINCDEKVNDDDGSYNFYNTVGLISLSECFCSKCGEELLYGTEIMNSTWVPPDCPCNGDIVFLKALNQVYCKECRREFVDIQSSDTENEEQSTDHSESELLHLSPKSTEEPGWCCML
ncbi:iap-like protein [Heliothis virescens ascovirus 3f]|uniref:Iap-like protein n=1 Tax=Heliothis virescens ascovirus 3f TaxID=328614 RepID=A0A171PVI6_9VIRU|nr:iap-like protein [Heliothis virescens ascovirus 3f]AJP09059.1 iap-like protein [Heliothis virescens ascovirus 3f]